jgi:bacterioferritin (cytochrome b1)
MNDIKSIIEHYNNCDYAKLLSNDKLSLDITRIQKLMADASNEDKEIARHFLKEVLVNVDTHISELTKQLKDISESMDNAKNIADACIAYSNAHHTKG